MQFDEDFSNIESGKKIVVDKMGVVKSTAIFGVAEIFNIFALKEGTGACVLKKSGADVSSTLLIVAPLTTLIKCKEACDKSAAACAAWQFLLGSSSACKLFNTGTTTLKGKGWPLCYPTPLPPKVFTAVLTEA